MSASARGIIVDATDAGRLILEASDAEVAQFGKGDLIEVGLLERRRVFPRYFYGQMGVQQSGPAWLDFSGIAGGERHGGPGNAILRTRCGCEKRLDVDMSAGVPRRYSVALASPLLAAVGAGPGADEMSLPSFRRRDFALRRTRADPCGRRVYEYEEEP